MSLAFFLAILSLQGRSPEESLKHIEKAIETAKSIRVRYSWSHKPDEDLEAVKAEGLFLLKEGNKAHVTGTFEREGVVSDLLIVSDGSRMRWRMADREFLETDTPCNLKKGLGKAFGRVGALQAAIFTQSMSRLDARDRAASCKAGDLLQIEDVKAGKDDRGLKTLTYTIKLGEDAGDVDAKIWYEPVSFRLKKRTLANGGTPLMTETYEEFVVNGDLPDDQFELTEVR